MYCVVILGQVRCPSLYPTQLKLMNFSGSGTLCVVSFESLMEFQMLDGWWDTAPERTEDNLQQTGNLASTRLEDDSRGGRAQHNGRSDNGKNQHKQD